MSDQIESMIGAPPLPTIGMEAWGEELNAYLTWLTNRPEYLFQSSSWQFSDAAPPATGNQVRLNNAQGALATLIDIRNLDNGGADRSSWFGFLAPGSFVRLQDWDNADVFYRYTVTGSPTIGADNTQIPVEWGAGNGVIPNAKCNVGFVVAFDPGGW